MASALPNDDSRLPLGKWFTATHWSIVLAAGEGSSTQAREALEKLCRTYWSPLYAYVRRYGYSPEDAQDLTQEFFGRFLENEYVKRADPGRGKFRTFLLSCLKNFLVNQWEKGRAAKRGGGQLITWKREDAETRYQVEPVEHLTPDKLYDRRWAMALQEQVIARLREEYARFGKLTHFDQLQGCLSGDPDQSPYAEIGQRLGMKEGAVKVAVHRLRHRYKEMLTAEVAQTITSPAELEEELGYVGELIGSCRASM